MIDRPTKALLFAIALGLWLQLADRWFIPQPVQASQLSGHVGAGALGKQDSTNVLAQIERHLRGLASGTCTNPRLC